MAKTFLKWARELLVPYNLTRHRVYFSCGMGSSSIWIGDAYDGVANTRNDEQAEEKLYNLRTRSDLANTILFIEDQLEWDFAAYLDKESLV